MRHKGRFGLSVACAGNLNLDGLSDRPYSKENRGIEVSFWFKIQLMLTRLLPWNADIIISWYLNFSFFQDMLVGAPYDGPDHKGAIYVYLGSAIRKQQGTEWKYAQVQIPYLYE